MAPTSFDQYCEVQNLVRNIFKKITSNAEAIPQVCRLALLKGKNRALQFIKSPQETNCNCLHRFFYSILIDSY